MADQAYNIFRRLLGSATAQPPGIDYLADDIRVFCVDTNQYSFDITHEFLTDIPVGARVASGLLTNKSVDTNGAWDADPLVLPTVSGNTFQCLIFVKDTGVAATSPLLVRIDSYTNLPTTPNSGDITITFPTDSNKILRP